MCLSIYNFKLSMDDFIRKRIDIATCWATNRISAMDTLERYEDSYAIAEEFREWILHIGEKNENLKDSVCLLYTSPSPRDVEESRMPSSA